MASLTGPVYISSSGRPSLTRAERRASVCSEHLQCSLARPQNTAAGYGPSSKCGGSVLLIRLHPLGMQAAVSMSSPPLNFPPNQWPPLSSAQAERPVD